MNVKHILNEIEKVDPEVYQRLDTRRNAMKETPTQSLVIDLAWALLGFTLFLTVMEILISLGE